MTTQPPPSPPRWRVKMYRTFKPHILMVNVDTEHLQYLFDAIMGNADAYLRIEIDMQGERV